MKVVLVRDRDQLLHLRPEWERLLTRSTSDTVFLTWEWASTWWDAYAGPRQELEILMAVDGQNTLHGIAPLQRRTTRRYGQTFSILSFIGDGSCDSDYLDFIINPAEEGPVIEAFCEYLNEELAHGTLLELNEIPESSPNLPFLRALGQGNGMVSREVAVPCAAVALPGNWQEYLRMLSPRFRTKVRSVLRNVDAHPDLQFHFCEHREELDHLLPCLFELHRQRWAKQAKLGVFRCDRKRVFYQTLSTALLERGWLRFSQLEWKGRVLACQYGFVYRNRYFQLQEGYDPACEHWNVGIALRAWSIQRSVESGLSEYDFLAGLGRHKADWGGRTKFTQRLVLGRRQPKNVLFCRGPEWAARTRRLLKQYVPDRVLAARNARQEQRRIAVFSDDETRANEASCVATWLRSTLAGCYCHSPLPLLLPVVRDRYELRLSPNGKWPRIAWHRRLAPSIRILYFHRVNDERDPFFPAMPTRQFEQQIRFVSRHYQVVTLAEAVKRLSEGRPPVPVIAITFDDGYQDNYLNAFPILQRYGLPATIFLTTGSIDSREPLWFEKLALAIKNTPRAFVDLEIDRPRRIWLRSCAERLRANAQLFAALRCVSEKQCQQYFSEILSQLGQRDHGERNDKMLTWTQIRYMKSKGFAFGGHTVTHPFVSRLSQEQATWEVSESKRRIEEELQDTVEHFAYPHGRDGDFQAWNKAVLRQAGYQAAVCTLWGVNDPTTDRMELRRGGPWEDTPALFGAKLDWYQWTNG